MSVYSEKTLVEKIHSKKITLLLIGTQEFIDIKK